MSYQNPTLGDFGYTGGFATLSCSDPFPAGPELDALVAKQVMRIDTTQICDGEWECEPWPGKCEKCRLPGSSEGLPIHTIQPKAYSTYIGAAWEVVEKMCGPPYYAAFVLKGTRGHLAEFHLPSHGLFEAITGPRQAPLAICYAALKASLAFSNSCEAQT